MGAAFDIDLNDGVSAPAAKAASGVKSLSDEFDRLQKSMASADKLIAKEKAGAGGADAAPKFEGNANNFKEEPADQLGPYKDLLYEILDVWKQIGIAIKDAAVLAIRLTQEKDALRETFGVLTGQGSSGGQKLLDELEDLAATLPFTADKLNGWAKSLLAAGIQGDALKESIKAVAAATAIMGESGGQAAMGLIKRFAMMAEAGQKVKLDRRILAQLAEAGISVKALAKALGVAPEKLGKLEIGAKELGAAMQRALIQQGAGPLAALGQTWDSISAKLREGFEDAFEDLGDLVHPFMKEIESLASEFFAGGVAAGTWKDVVKSALTVVFEVGTRTVRALHIAFLELQIAFLQVKIALKPVTSALGELGISGKIVSVVMYFIGASALILAAVLGILALAVLLIAAPFIIAGIAIYAVVQAISAVIDFIGEAIDNFDNMQAAVTNWASSAAQAGANFVSGLVGSLMSGVGAVADAARNLALSAKNAVFGALGIRSPSRVMMRAGMYTSEGLAMGIEQGQADIEAAAGGAAGAAVSGASGGLGARGGTGGGIVINEVTIQVMGDGKTWQQVTREALALVLEEAALQAGLGGATS